MKVLHVLDTSIPDTAGYTTRAKYLVVNQNRLGIEPVVLTSERFKGVSGAAEESIAGIRYYRTRKKGSCLRRVPVLAELDEIKTLARRIAEVAAREKVDIVHAHSPSLNGAAALKYCRGRNIPLVYEIRAIWEKVPHDHVSLYYSIIDLLVYPRISKRITELVTPLKPLEAMAMEKAVLMSDVGGLKELADAENVAAFFKAGDVTELAVKCLELCEKPELRKQIGLNARQNVIANWGWDKRAAADIEIYKQLVR